MLDNLDTNDIEALTSAGQQIRSWILDTPLSDELLAEIRTACDELSAGHDISVAVRSCVASTT